MKKTLVLLFTLFLSVSFAQEQTTLTVASFPDLSTATKAAAEVFEQENPNVTVNVVEKEFNDHHTALLTTLASGAGAPDVTAIEVGFIAQFVGAGGFEDLTQEPYNAGQYKEQTAGYAWEQGSTPEGSLVAMPVDLGPGTMYYRQDLFEQAGIDPSAAQGSWEDYLEVGRQLKEQNIRLIPNATHVANAIIRSETPEGEGFYFDSEGNPNVTEERFQKAFRIAKAIRDEGLDLNVSDWSPEWAAGLKEGTVATEMFGFWLQGFLQSNAPDTAGDWRVSNLPGGAYTSWGGSFYAIPQAAQNKELAWQFIEFMTTREDIQKLAFEEIGAFPSVTTVYDDPIFEEPLEFLGGQEGRQVAIEVVNNIKNVATYPNDNLATEIIGDQLTQVLTQDKDIDTALAEAQRLIERRAGRR